MKAFVTVTQQQFDISAEQGVPEYSAFVTVSQEQFIIVVQDPTGDVLTQSVEFGNFIKGKDGSVIYNGSGVPANTLGVNGDFYIDNVAPNNYYKKISCVWVLQGYFQGEQGEYTVITIGENGNWCIDGEDSGQRAIGIDGYTPIIGENNNWWINGVDTGKRAVGIDGVGISNWELVSTVGKVKTYRITFTDSTTFEYSITDGTDGNDGREVLIQNNGTYIQWQYEGDTEWTNIVELSTLKGDTGANIELQKSATHIQWRVVGDANWIDLIALADLKGNDGRGIMSIIKTSTQELTDTYTITYTDGTTSTFDVTNGLDGISVESITLYETVGLVDTYEIIYSSGSRSYFDVTNGADGKGIVSIIKTSTVGLVDTYTITYSDSTTSTFDITNGTSAYEIYHAGGGTLSEVDYNASITNIPSHIADETIHHTLEELNEVYELLSNKKTNLTDNSDVFYPTQKAVNTALDLKIDKTAIKQASGTSTTDVMSQKAVSDELAALNMKIDSENNIQNFTEKQNTFIAKDAVFVPSFPYNFLTDVRIIPDEGTTLVGRNFYIGHIRSRYFNEMVQIRLYEKIGETYTQIGQKSYDSVNIAPTTLSEITLTKASNVSCKIWVDFSITNLYFPDSTFQGKYKLDSYYCNRREDLTKITTEKTLPSNALINRTNIAPTTGVANLALTGYMRNRERFLKYDEPFVSTFPYHLLLDIKLIPDEGTVLDGRLFKIGVFRNQTSPARHLIQIYEKVGEDIILKCQLYNNTTALTGLQEVFIPKYSTSDVVAYVTADFSNINADISNTGLMYLNTDYFINYNKIEKVKEIVVGGFSDELYLNLFPNQVSSLFLDKIRNQNDDLEIIWIGDSLVGLIQRATPNVNAANLPPDKNFQHLTYMLWDRICKNKVFADRWDSAVNEFIESEVFTDSGDSKFNTPNWAGEYSEQTSICRQSNVANAALSFGWDLDAFEKLNFIDRKSVDGAVSATITVVEGDNKVEIYDVNTTAWIEANGYILSQYIDPLVATDGSGYTRHMRNIRRKLRRKTGATGNVTITVSKGVSTSEYLYYWGTERWNGYTIHVTNLGRGGRSTGTLLKNIKNDIGERNPDFVIYNMPLANERNGTLVNLKEQYDLLITELSSLSSGFADFQTLFILPHQFGYAWDGDKAVQYGTWGGDPDPIDYRQYRRMKQYLIDGLPVENGIVDIGSQLLHEAKARMLTYEEAFDGGIKALTTDNIHFGSVLAKLYIKYIAPLFD